MSIPDFDRAEYDTPPPALEGTVVDSDGYTIAPQRPALAVFPLALLYGAIAAVVGAVGYALVGLTGFMVSIITIAIGYLVARAMMTATRGIGGQPYQVAAVAMTYFSATIGDVLDDLYHAHQQGMAFSEVSPIFLVKYAVFGPILEVIRSPGWGLLGLLILFYGLRTAWQMAAGTPGFGQQGGPRMTVMGVRR
jgi:hypothetical protein